MIDDTLDYNIFSQILINKIDIIQLNYQLDFQSRYTFENTNADKNDFFWIYDQITRLYNDPKKCSYERFYRNWYVFYHAVKIKNVTCIKINYIFDELCNLIVPLFILKICIVNKTLYKFSPLNILMKDIMLYPLNQLKYNLNHLYLQNSGLRYKRLFDNLKSNYSDYNQTYRILNKILPNELSYLIIQSVIFENPPYYTGFKNPITLDKK